MCGIFGLLVNQNSPLTLKQNRAIVDDLFLLSESRGKEASGFAYLHDNYITICKDAVPASTLIKSKPYKDLFNQHAYQQNEHSHDSKNPFILIGHSRLVTNGAMEIHENNQPVHVAHIVGVHNGIIVNDEELWGKFTNLKRNYQIDTEVLLALVRYFYEQNQSLIRSLKMAFSLIKGTFSIALLFQDLNVLVLATNHGSLYQTILGEQQALIFASERYILDSIINRIYLRKLFNASISLQVKPNSGLCIDLENLNLHSFNFGDEDTLTLSDTSYRHVQRNVIDIKNPALMINPQTLAKRINHNNHFSTEQIDVFYRQYEETSLRVKELRRCTRCVLPQTMPFIHFDENGVCNFCLNYNKVQVKGKNALLSLFEQYPSENHDIDCLIGISGGRDSSYGLHYLTQHLNKKPLAFTYDWGMVTDLARRNIARICGKLQVEHILLSADIAYKRANIRRNVNAWLKRPDLGVVPLFMAGDKQYFHFANKLKEQNKVQLVILCENPLERTNFKTGFCGVEQPYHPSIHALPLLNQLKMLLYYGKQFILNPAYINLSLLDTMDAFFSFYTIPHTYINLYDYVEWDEDEISHTLINQYDWETAKDTKNTWRIGDGTAPFYNYIYYMMAGLTENDTFRSNQIREGKLTREEALVLLERDNQPRYDSIQWYCNTIGIDMIEALRVIHNAPQLFA